MTDQHDHHHDGHSVESRHGDERASLDTTSDAASDAVSDAEIVDDDPVMNLGSLGSGEAGLDAGLGAGLGGLDMGAMLQMAQDMGQRMQDAQEELASTQIDGTAGGGVVTVTLNGHLHLIGLHIDPSAVDLEDLSMLEDLIVAAWSDARDGVAQVQAQSDPMAGLGGLGGLGGLLGG